MICSKRTIAAVILLLCWFLRTSNRNVCRIGASFLPTEVGACSSKYDLLCTCKKKKKETGGIILETPCIAGLRERISYAAAFDSASQIAHPFVRLLDHHPVNGPSIGGHKEIEVCDRQWNCNCWTQFRDNTSCLWVTCNLPVIKGSLMTPRGKVPLSTSPIVLPLVSSSA